MTLIFFPARRDAIATTAGKLACTLSGATRAVIGRSSTAVSGSCQQLSWFGREAASYLRQHRFAMGGAMLLVVTPPLLVVGLKEPAAFDFSSDGYRPDRQISVLLTGENLTPPPAPPPEVFATTELEMVRPSVVWASRDWGLLDIQFRQRLLTVFKLMKDRHGYELVLLEGYRSPERQEALLQQGPNVTQAGPNMSYHQHGLAADTAFLRNGRVVISERDPWAMRGYQLYGELAEAVGLVWGGRWKMMDLGHVELNRTGVLGRPPS
nr:M15 family metallopeptidase [Aromatoleum diolicum]